MQQSSGKAKLGLTTLICLIVGNMIGVGLYVNSYYSLSSLGDARLVLLVWFVGGLHALCGAIAYGAVAKRLPVSGGEYAYLSRCVHPGMGFVAGWISIVAGFTAPIAVTSMLLSQYVFDLTDVSGEAVVWQKKIVASVAIWLAAALFAVHLKVGTGFNNLVIAFKLVCFTIFLAVGIPFIFSTPSDGFHVSGTGVLSQSLTARLLDPATMHAMCVQMFYVSLAYTGFNASIYLVGDVESDTTQSGKLAARSMWLACSVVIVLYLLLNAVFLYGMDGSAIVAAQEGFVPVVAKSIGGDWLAWIMRVAILLSAMTSVLAMMATGPMVYLQMARDNMLPKSILAPNHNLRRAVAIQALLSCIVVWVSSIEGLISYLGLTLTACGALAVSSIWLAKSKIEAVEPIRWYEHIATAIYVLGAIGLLLVASQSETQVIRFYLCIGTFVLGAVFYAISHRH